MASVEKKQAVVEVLKSMGFPENHTRKALDHIDPNHPQAVELCIHWMGLNPMTDQFKKEELEQKITNILDMGFTRAKAIDALKQHGENLDASLNFLLEQQAKEQAAKQAKIERDAKRKREIEERRKKRIEQREKKMEEMHLQLPTPDAVRYGSCVSLFNEELGAFMVSLPQEPDLYTNSAKMQEACKFMVVNPNDDDDNAEMCGNCKVGLRATDGCYIGVEADGSVHSNRHELGMFMVWTLKLADDLKSTAKIKPGSVVLLESALHNTLKGEKDGCTAKDKETLPLHHWKVELQRIMKSPRSSRKSAQLGDKIFPVKTFSYTGKMSGKALWDNLRRTFRLRMLRMVEQRIEDLHERLFREKKQLEAQEEEEQTCIICWDAEPNTVLIECGHICVCDECGAGLKGNNCPVCRAEVVECVKMIR